MKLNYLFFVSLILSISILSAAPPPEEDFTVAAGTTYSGNISTDTGDIIVYSGARVTGQVKSNAGDIFIEEGARVKKIISLNGDVFLDKGVTVDQSITMTYGSLYVKANSTLKGDVLTESGDINISGSYLSKSIKTRHGDIMLRDNTYVKKNIIVLDRGNTNNLESLEIYLGTGVEVNGDVEADDDDDLVLLAIFEAEVNGDIDNVTIIGEEPPDDCGGVAAWVSSQVYTEGHTVSHASHIWLAGWWTQNQEPGTTGQNGVWQDQGPCSGVNECGGRPIWTSSAIFDTDDEAQHDGLAYRAKWWTRGDDPSTSGQYGPWEYLEPCDGAGGNVEEDECGGLPAWSSSVQYKKNDEVHRNGTAYRAKKNSSGKDPSSSSNKKYWKDIGDC